jgi:hypothetical protein
MTWSEELAVHNAGDEHNGSGDHLHQDEGVAMPSEVAIYW